MPFEVVLNYLKNSGVPNLVHTLDDSFRDETFNGILDYLISVSPKFDRTDDQKIIQVIDDYRRRYRTALEQIALLKNINQPMSCKVDAESFTARVIDEHNNAVSLSEYDPVLSIKVTNLDKKIRDYIKKEMIKTPEGKEIDFDILELMFDYLPYCDGEPTFQNKQEDDKNAI